MRGLGSLLVGLAENAPQAGSVQELFWRGKGAEPGASDVRDALLRALRGHAGEGVVARSPFIGTGRS